MKAIGIDIGTSNSCVVVGEDLATLEPMTTCSANGVVPSFVSVGPTAVYCGEAALQRHTAHPERTFYEFKRTIGRKWRQHSLWESTAKHLTFKLGMPNNPEDPPVYGATLNSKFVQLTSFDLYVYLLKHMFQDFPNDKPVACVATVPAKFTGPQRDATKKAVMEALPQGSFVTTLNEPTAAAIAYMSKVSKEEVTPGDYLLILDVGGGTTDATLVRVEQEGCIDVIRSMGDHDNEVGGAKLTDIIHTWALTHCRKHGLKIAKDGSALLHDRCEEIKRALSMVDEASLALSGVVVGDGNPLVLTRAKFNELVHNEISAMCEIATQTTALETSEVKHVVLVGGATRTPSLRQCLGNIYTKAKITTCLNPETAVARGAAIQALDLLHLAASTAAAPAGATTSSCSFKPKLLSETLNATISLRVKADQSFALVKRGTRLPCKVSHSFAPMNEKQSRMLVVLAQGEHKKSSCNDVLGRYEIPRACVMRVTIKVGFDGSVRVEAIEKKTGKKILKEHTRTHGGRGASRS